MVGPVDDLPAWRGGVRLAQRFGLALAVLLAAAGPLALLISELLIEAEDGFYLRVGPRSVRMPESGLLGDGGTYMGAWGVLGFAFPCAAVFLWASLRLRQRVARVVSIAMSILALFLCGSLLRMVGFLF